MAMYSCIAILCLLAGKHAWYTMRGAAMKMLLYIAMLAMELHAHAGYSYIALIYFYCVCRFYSEKWLDKPRGGCVRIIQHHLMILNSVHQTVLGTLFSTTVLPPLTQELCGYSMCLEYVRLDRHDENVLTGLFFVVVVVLVLIVQKLSQVKHHKNTFIILPMAVLFYVQSNMSPHPSNFISRKGKKYPNFLL